MMGPKEHSTQDPPLLFSPYSFEIAEFQEFEEGEFPGGPVVRTQRFHGQGPGFNPWLGN